MKIARMTAEHLRRHPEIPRDLSHVTTLAADIAWSVYRFELTDVDHAVNLAEDALELLNPSKAKARAEADAEVDYLNSVRT